MGEERKRLKQKKGSGEIFSEHGTLYTQEITLQKNPSH